jgi:hypothetical protein
MTDGDGSGELEPEPEPEFTVFYRLDRQDLVIDIGGRGFAEAIAGQDPDAIRGRIIGTSLFDHVAGHFTRRFLREFLGVARSARVQRRRMYRCDSTTDKIVMEMRATAEADGGVLLEHREVMSQPLSIPVPLAFAKTWKTANARRCSMCNRLQARGATHWVEPDAFVAGGASLIVIHTVCQACRVVRGEAKMKSVRDLHAASLLTDTASTRLRERSRS